ncbi:MAG TPA: FkbM family methyltransferase [Thermoplasmata archaeon]|nr:FkbM family methyltransferase [Thermoplasmata archaeon]
MSTGLDVLSVSPKHFAWLLGRFILRRAGPDRELATLVQQKFTENPRDLVRLRDGSVVHIDPQDRSFLSPNIAILRHYESATTQLIRYLAHSRATVVDVGGNVGWFTLVAAKSVGVGGRVVTLEPEPRAFRLLSQTVAENGLKNVHLVNAGAWDRKTTLRLRLSPDTNRGSHSLVREMSGNGVDIQCVRLDELLPTLGVDVVEVMKIDVEGAEPNVLEGCLGLIAKGAIRNIVLEWNPEGWESRRPLLARLEREYDFFPFEPSVPFRRLTGGAPSWRSGVPLSYLYLRQRGLAD